jgi:hypothetical protein
LDNNAVRERDRVCRPGDTYRPLKALAHSWLSSKRPERRRPLYFKLIDAVRGNCFGKTPSSDSHLPHIYGDCFNPQVKNHSLRWEHPGCGAATSVGATAIGRIFAKFQTGFYADASDVVFKALGVG